MFRSLIALSVFALSVFAAMLNAAVAQDDSLAKQVKLVEDRTKKAIVELKKVEIDQDFQLERLKNGVIDKKLKEVISPAYHKHNIRFPNKETKDKLVKTADENLTQTKDIIKKYMEGNDFHYGVLDYPMKIGDFGKIYPKETMVLVLQVIDKNTMLIRADSTFVGVNRNPIKVTLMVKGVSMKGATDGNGFDLPQVFEVTDTETYNTVGGSNTVFVIEPMDTKKIEACLKK